MRDSPRFCTNQAKSASGLRFCFFLSGSLDFLALGRLVGSVRFEEANLRQSGSLAPYPACWQEIV
jgi:hypothetical protein